MSGDGEQVVIYGTGGMGREVLDILLAHNAAGDAPAWDVLGFLTDAQEEHGSEVCGYPVLGGRNWLTHADDVCVVCQVREACGEVSHRLTGNLVQVGNGYAFLTRRS